MTHQHDDLYRMKLGALIMNMTLTTLLASTLVSCATFGVSAEDGRRPTTSNGTITRGNGNASGGNNNDSSGPGDRSHGFHGERWQDNVPRTPMWLIQAFTGERNSPVHPEGNERGITNWWRGDRAVDQLISRIEIGYDYGARWFFVNRPMGTNGYTHVPAASWLTLEDDKREDLPQKLTDALLDHFDEPVHIVWFIGSEMSDPRDFSGWSQSRDQEFYGIGEDDNWQELISSRVTLGGWISTGASGVGIDACSKPDEREHFIRLFESLNGFPFHLNVYGEAYPYKETNGAPIRDHRGSPILCEESITKMPWIGATSYFENVWSIDSPGESFPVDEYETRMFIWFDQSPLRFGNENQRRVIVNKYMDLGLIPITFDPVMFSEALERLGSGMSSDQGSNESTSRSNGDSSAGGNSGSSNRVIIRPSSVRRSAANSAPRTSVPDQELPDRYQHKGKGIR